MPRETFLDYLDATADTQMRVSHHCAQATFVSLQEGFDLDGAAIVKALTPLPGIAERGETCGAVTGSLLALGLIFGRDRIDDWPAWRASLGPAQAFCTAFTDQFGSTQCGDVQHKLFGRSYDLADPDQLRAFQSATPGPTELCGKVVRRAVRIAAEIILDKHPKA
jgi:C_GCAxxG_C_C family probable redox protein